MDRSRSSVLLPIRNALANANQGIVSDADIIAMLRGQPYPGAMLRAVFEDNSLAALARAGDYAGVDIAAILTSYAAARTSACAANTELDNALLGGWD